MAMTTNIVGVLWVTVYQCPLAWTCSIVCFQLSITRRHIPILRPAIMQEEGVAFQDHFHSEWLEQEGNLVLSQWRVCFNPDLLALDTSSLDTV